MVSIPQDIREKAREALGFSIFPKDVAWSNAVDRIAQALLDMREATARECVQIAYEAGQKDHNAFMAAREIEEQFFPDLFEASAGEVER